MSASSKLDDWDFDPTKTTTDPLLLAARSYARHSAEIEKLNAERDAAEAAMLAFFDSDVDEQTVVRDGIAITMKRGETWTWDTEKLKALCATIALSHPAYIKDRWSISRRDFMALSPAEQALLLPSLTRKPRKPAFEVKEGGE